MTGSSPPARRAAWLEIDLGAIRHNISVIRSLVGEAAVAPVVKADAYGHGVDRVGPVAAEVADALCVATLDEALALRSLTPGRVLLLYPVPDTGAADAVAADIELTVMSRHDLQLLRSAVAPDQRPVVVHLCVDTGMGRGGVRPRDAAALAVEIAADHRFRLAALWSHLATPEDPSSASEQVRRFEAATETLQAAGLAPPVRHIAASGGIFIDGAPAYELVRPGLAIYGLLGEGLPVATDATAAAASLRPAMALKARAAAFSDVPVGDGVGYGSRWRARRSSRVAILPVGYADGYLRATQPGAVALLGGVRRPLVGVVSMDAVAVDVTDSPAVNRDDEFVLLGEQAGEVITATELARARNTIAWEVLTSMAPRLGRVYYPEAGTTFPE